MNQTIPYTPISDARIAEFTTKAAEVGARTRIVRQILVNQDCDWNSSIDLVGPHTPGDHDVRKIEVGSQYLPVFNGKIETDIVLLNYYRVTSNWNRGIDWGKKARLNVVNPREIFAIGEQKPDLSRVIDQNPMYLVAPIQCSLYGHSCACFVWWVGQECGVSLDPIVEFSNPCVWFAFREPIS